ncbi:hypothetical protein AM500_06090 [Bacillus sp. FJAT-18017]|uniref:hypothetical protein n=1 Tax=Bacillus sp. FJAT-18017 TaxID=1705566 RepID=UPI0006AFE098|nr:hypothetical protein [Bacillus sp. FJAT-18017]ALC89401.1 hypothetical protein AM500_06090 [Bacillus sp. FJAT-18017]
MDAYIWQIISIAGYSLAGLMFVAAVFMFFKLNIPAIYGDLSGRTAAKQIREIREQNSNSGRKVFQPDAFNLERGELTSKVESKSRRLRKALTQRTGSKRLDKKGQTVEASHPTVVSIPTDVLSQNSGRDVHTAASAPIYSSDGTVVLFSTDEGPIQRDSTFQWGDRQTEDAAAIKEEAGRTLETTVLAGYQSSNSETTVLSDQQSGSTETTVLVNDLSDTAETTFLAGGQNGGAETTVPPIVQSGGAETTILVQEGHAMSAAETEVLFQKEEGFGFGKEVLLDGAEILSPEIEDVAAGTEVLSEGTEVLGEMVPGTVVLAGGVEAFPSMAMAFPNGAVSSGGDLPDTQVLSEGTTVLAGTTLLETEETVKQPIEFRVIKNIVIIHTNEVL